MTNHTSETVESQMKRLGDAIELKKVEIIKDGLEAIVRSDEKTAKEFMRPRTA